jgi:hypothetical protein
MFAAACRICCSLHVPGAAQKQTFCKSVFVKRLREAAWNIIGQSSYSRLEDDKPRRGLSIDHSIQRVLMTVHNASHLTGEPITFAKKDHINAASHQHLLIACITLKPTKDRTIPSQSVQTTRLYEVEPSQIARDLITYISF